MVLKLFIKVSKSIQQYTLNYEVQGFIIEGLI